MHLRISTYLEFSITIPVCGAHLKFSITIPDCGAHLEISITIRDCRAHFECVFRDFAFKNEYSLNTNFQAIHIFKQMYIFPRRETQPIESGSPPCFCDHMKKISISRNKSSPLLGEAQKVESGFRI